MEATDVKGREAAGVEIRFRTRELRRCFEQEGRAQRRWGTAVGTRYRQRLTHIEAQTTWDNLYRLRMLGLHPLRGDRAGQFAIRLTGAVRLIVERGATTTQIVVVDVEDYHG